MSAALGPRRFDTGQDMVFLGKELAQGHDYSDVVAEKIGTEIEEFLFKARAKAREILTEHPINAAYAGKQIARRRNR